MGEATPSATTTLSPTVAPTVVVTSPTIMITPTIIQDKIPQLGFNNNLLILLASTLSLLGLYLVLY